MAPRMETLENVWSGFQTLTPPQREQFFERLLDDANLRGEREDLLDLATVADRLDEPTRPLGDVLAEIGRAGDLYSVVVTDAPRCKALRIRLGIAASDFYQYASLDVSSTCAVH